MMDDGHGNSSPPPNDEDNDFIDGKPKRVSLPTDGNSLPQNKRRRTSNSPSPQLNLTDSATWHGDSADGGEKPEYIKIFEEELRESCSAPELNGLLPFCSLKEFKILALDADAEEKNEQFKACVSDDDIALEVYAAVKQRTVEELKNALRLNFPPIHDEAFWRTLEQDNSRHLHEEERSLVGDSPNDDFIEVREAVRRNAMKSGKDIFKLAKRKVKQNKRLAQLRDPESANQAYECIIKAYPKQAPTSDDARAYVHNKLKKHYDSQSEVEKKEKLKCITYHDEDRQRHQAYYVGHANFRHQGKSGGAPPLVFLKEPEKKYSRSIRPFVYYTPSGTGKSVEVASGAFTREAVMTVVHYEGRNVTKETEMKKHYQNRDDEVDFVNDRLKIIKAYVKIIMEKLCKAHTEVFEIIMKAVQELEKAGNKNIVRLVVAIDEASNVKYLVRSLIAENAKMMETAETVLRNEFHVGDLQSVEFQVVFSVAGTGTSASTVGSIREHYHILQPTALAQPKEVYNALGKYLAEDYVVPKYDDVVEYPMLKVLATNNARMTSILVHQLAIMKADYKLNDGQTNILQNVFETFVNSNGLSKLDGQWHEAAAAGAQTLAIHLFQEDWNVPDNEQEMIEKSMDFTYGITFEDECRDIHSTEDLVKTLGLVSSNIVTDVEKNTTVETPFKVDPAMQLLSMWLLMGGVSKPSSTNFLSPTPFGFEVLSTQLVSCVLAASLTLPADKRPNVKTLLQQQLGFFCQESWSNAFYKDGETLKPSAQRNIRAKARYNEAEWRNAEDNKNLFDDTYGKIIVTGTSFKGASDSLHGTYFQQVEMKVTNQTKFKHYEDSSIISSETGEVVQGILDAQEIFNADRAFIKLILQGLNEVDTTGRFNPPIASISFGSSEFVDGLVLFAGTKRTIGNNQQTNNDENGIEAEDADDNQQTEPTQAALTNNDSIGDEAENDDSTPEINNDDTDENESAADNDDNGIDNDNDNNEQAATASTLTSTDGNGIEAETDDQQINTVNNGNNQQPATTTTVTATATNVDENGSSQLYCIGIQAKDYFDSSNLDAQKIQKNARTLREPVLDDVFGDKRLYCVASHKTKLETKQAPLPYARPFVAFPIGKSRILGDWMKYLTEERGIKNQFTKYGVGVTNKFQDFGICDLFVSAGDGDDDDY